MVGHLKSSSRYDLGMLNLKLLASLFWFLLPGNLLFTVVVRAQDQTSGPWVMQSSGTKASLRGIHAVGGGVAWASGTNGTILRTEDGGYMWQSCAMPPGAEKLDFRGIWAWDAQTAIVMSSGPGDQSRLYKTTDGCSSWKLLFTNPDRDGFWDAVVFWDSKRGFVLGDPVKNKFVLLDTLDQGKTWGHVETGDLDQGKTHLGAFAASNSALVAENAVPSFGTSGPDGPYYYAGNSVCTMLTAQSHPEACSQRFLRFEREKLPLAGNSASAGIFSIAQNGLRLVAVGGEYTKPNESQGSAAWSADIGKTWTAAEKPPHGYRSAVAWDADAKAWIAAGTNGSDISYDDGKTWSPLDNGNWNALSLPWVVGPDGRIARLGALPPRK
jgi:photosystem II stability/assembly factor-like uncharacterized protein